MASHGELIMRFASLFLFFFLFCSLVGLSSPRHVDAFQTDSVAKTCREESDVLAAILQKQQNPQAADSQNSQLEYSFSYNRDAADCFVDMEGERIGPQTDNTMAVILNKSFRFLSWIAASVNFSPVIDEELSTISLVGIAADSGHFIPYSTLSSNQAAEPQISGLVRANATSALLGLRFSF